MTVVVTQLMQLLLEGTMPVYEPLRLEISILTQSILMYLIAMTLQLYYSFEVYFFTCQ